MTARPSLAAFPLLVACGTQEVPEVLGAAPQSTVIQISFETDTLCSELHANLLRQLEDNGLDLATIVRVAEAAADKPEGMRTSEETLALRYWNDMYIDAGNVEGAVRVQLRNSKAVSVNPPWQVTNDGSHCDPLTGILTVQYSAKLDEKISQ